MKVPSWLAWIIIRIAMEFGTIRLWSKGLKWSAARRIVARETLSTLRSLP